MTKEEQEIMDKIRERSRYVFEAVVETRGPYNFNAEISILGNHYVVGQHFERYELAMQHAQKEIDRIKKDVDTFIKAKMAPFRIAKE